MSAIRVAVVGGGISGLAAGVRLMEESRAAGRAIEVTVLEACDHAGGHATTIDEDGFIVETGPNAFLDRPREPHTMELVRSLGLESRLIEARAASRKRFVLHRRRLHRAPDAPPTLLSSGALSPLAKLRVLLEPWARSAPPQVEETVHDFARRRIGEEAARVLVDAAVAGISAGDSRRLSVSAAFPSMIEMEREYGSLIRAMMRRRGEARPRLMSFDRGMRVLIDALRDRLGASLRVGARVRAIERERSTWRIEIEGGESLSAERVVLALPAPRAAEIVCSLDAELARVLAGVPYGGLAMVALAFRASDLGSLDGYGYLVARDEGLDTLGVLWESSVFDGRAPRGMALLRVMLGGVRRPEVVERSERDLIARARAELAPVMGEAEPVRTWVRRWPGAIAQYELGHAARVAAARARAASHPGLELAGTSYDGVSFTGAVRSGFEVARRVIATLEGSFEHAKHTSPLDRGAPRARAGSAS
jgi:oxygen-dependent protoporphyrinogen oxidase